jgi:hypothetical protein
LPRRRTGHSDRQLEAVMRRLARGGPARLGYCAERNLGFSRSQITPPTTE